jgi:RimJ/RimL family protein N-acetyltransferase
MGKKSSSIKIGMMSPNRWKEYKELRLKALKEDPQAFGFSYEEEVDTPDKKWQAKLRKSQEKKSRVIIFASDKNRLVGMIVARLETEQIKQEHVAEIVGFFVEKTYRGQGIGEKLFGRILEELKTLPKIIKVELYVNPRQTSALAIYRRFGFQEIGTFRKELKMGNKFYDSLAMELFLR